MLVHYTSWGPRTGPEAKLFAEGGPEVIAVFRDGEISLGEETWLYAEDVLTLPDGRSFSLEGNPKSDRRLAAHLAGVEYTLVRETFGDWIIDDAAGNKVAQFSSTGGGVRKSILEFEKETALPEEHVVALSYYARRCLELRLERTNWSMLGTLVILTVVGIITIAL